MNFVKRILCVDDDTDSLDLLKFLLETNDYVVYPTASSEEALEFIKNESFDLYVLDYKLPEMSGIELCLHIRQSDCKTPIIFFSAMARPIDRSLGLAVGANDYLIKPDDLGNLCRIVKHLLKTDDFVPDTQPSVLTKDRLW